jgi:hypothetical protein
MKKSELNKADGFFIELKECTDVNSHGGHGSHNYRSKVKVLSRNKQRLIIKRDKSWQIEVI